jgi:hypothetical protein
MQVLASLSLSLWSYASLWTPSRKSQQSRKAYLASGGSMAMMEFILLYKVIRSAIRATCSGWLFDRTRASSSRSESLLSSRSCRCNCLLVMSFLSSPLADGAKMHNRRKSVSEKRVYTWSHPTVRTPMQHAAGRLCFDRKDYELAMISWYTGWYLPLHSLRGSQREVRGPILPNPKLNNGR